MSAHDTDASLARRGAEDLAPTGEPEHGPAAERTTGPAECRALGADCGESCLGAPNRGESAA